jgi:hypothetical protein
MMPRTVCLDFDGVMNTYTGWKGEQELFEPRSGLKDFLERLQIAGYSVVVNSSRDAAGIRLWLNTHGLSGLVEQVTNVKPPAIVYLDDRGVTFRGDFDEAFSLITAFHPYWEKR